LDVSQYQEALKINDALIADLKTAVGWGSSPLFTVNNRARLKKHFIQKGVFQHDYLWLRSYQRNRRQLCFG
jgi:hypothetical protein